MSNRLAMFLTLAVLGPAVAAQEGEAPAKPDPEVAAKLRQFKDYVSDRKMQQDLEARRLIDEFLQLYPRMHPKDQRDVSSTLGDVFTRIKQRPKEQQELYIAASVALSRMGSTGAKELRDAFNNNRFRKKDWVGLRANLILGLGKTKDEKYWKFILDVALADPEDQIMARAGEALGEFEDSELKVRREIVKRLVKRFNEIFDASRTLDTGDVTAQTKQRTYAAIADPWNTTLAKLTGEKFRMPPEWQHWWNKNKNEDWDKARKKTSGS